MNFQVPRISQSTHTKVFLSSRFVKFKQSLNNCNKQSIRILAKLNENDLRTVFGQNLNNIAESCDVSKELLCPNLVKAEMNYFLPPENEAWRSSVIHELLEARKDTRDLHGFEKNEISEMLSYLCTN